MVARVRRTRRRRKGNKVATTVKKYVNKRIHSDAEVKRLDFSNLAGGTLIPTAGIIVYLSGTDQGASDINRLGNQVKPKGLRIRWFYQNQTTNFDYLRIIVFQYKRGTTAGTVLTPLVSDIIRNSNVGLATNGFSFINNSNDEGIHLLHDKMHLSLGSSGTVAPVQGAYNARAGGCGVINIPAKRMLQKIQYNAGTSAAPDAGYGAVYMIVINGLGNNVNQFWYTSAFSFVDK